MPDLELLLEGERRGLLDQDQQDLLSEARNRGMIEGGGAPPEAQPPIAPPEEENPGILSRTGRLLGEDVSAIAGIPGAALDVVTGGKQGRLDALLRVLRGVGAPLAMPFEPAAAVAEKVVRGLGGSEDWARLAGTGANLASTFGFGAVAKTGALGETGQTLARLLGVGRPRTYEEMIARDPQLRFATERVPTEVRPLEALARNEAVTAEDLAMAVKSERMAAEILKQKGIIYDAVTEESKAGGLGGKVPAVPSYSPEEGIEFVYDRGKDLGAIGSLGTPSNQAARINKYGAAAQNEMMLTEININAGRRARDMRDVAALGSLADNVGKEVVLARQRDVPIPELLQLPDDKLAPEAKRALQYLDEKWQVDRNILIPRMRDMLRNRVEKIEQVDLITKNNKIPSAEELAAVTEKSLKKLVPDNMAADAMLTYLMPGEFVIKTKTGGMLMHAQTELEAKSMIYELVKNSNLLPSEITAKRALYFDDDMLRLFSGRMKRTLEGLTKAADLTPEAIAAAAQGDFYSKGKFGFLTPLVERGKAPNYTKDLIKTLSLYNRTIEHFLQYQDVAAKVRPIIKDLRGKGLGNLAYMLDTNLQILSGKRSPASAFLDSTLAAIPVVRDLVSPNLLERWISGSKAAAVNLMLRYNPKFHAVNATQIFQTLAPIADWDEIAKGVKLKFSDEGKLLLDRHGITGAYTKMGTAAKTLGASEQFNQDVAFLTMYNRATKLGLSDARAADYAKLRGNIYSQFMGLATDQPLAFRKLDPLGIFTMFQRFNIKQAEQMIDLIKSRDFPGAGKWLAANLVLGGFKAATVGEAGWLTYKTYHDIKERYGEAMADVFHVGLPGLIGLDVSNSAQLFSPPFGDTWAERAGNMLKGPIFSPISSVFDAATDSAAIDPDTKSRMYRAMVQRVPAFRMLDGVARLITGDYDLKDPAGRLRYKADTATLVRRAFGARSIADANLDTFGEALADMKQRRDEVIDFAASRYGTAMLNGVPLGESMMAAIRKEVDNWNGMWPEFPITGEDLMSRAKARQQSAAMDMRQRLLRQAPLALKKTQIFGASEDLLPGGD